MKITDTAVGLEGTVNQIDQYLENQERDAVFIEE